MSQLKKTKELDENRRMEQKFEAPGRKMSTREDLEGVCNCIADADI